MKSIMTKLWNDDAGIVALEYLLVATIVGLGLVVGLSALSASLNVELAELGNAILALDTGYSITGSTSTNVGSSAILGVKNGTNVTHSVDGKSVTFQGAPAVAVSDRAF